MAVLTNTPFTGRRNSQSVLDFMYWVMQQVQITQPSGRAPVRTDDDRTLSASLVEYAASQVGIGLPPGFDFIKNFCNDQDTFITQTNALMTRGALLFVDGAVLVSMGDGKRIVDVRSGQHFIRYVENSEVFETGARVPHLRYR